MSNMDKPKRSVGFGGKCHAIDCGEYRTKVSRMANGDIKTQCLKCGAITRWKMVTSGPEGCKGRLTVVEEGE